MTKTSKILISLLSSLLLLTPTVVKADEEISAEGTELISLTASVPSSYTIKFPKSVNITSAEESFYIDVKGEMSTMEKLVITIPETATLTETVHDSSTARTVDVTIESSKSEFVSEDLSTDTYNEDDARATVALTHDEIVAGEWTGSISMVVALTDRYEAGTLAPE